MGGYVNEVTLLGYLGGDPEARGFGNSGRVVAFNVATAEAWRDRTSGERRERTQWHRVAVLAEGLAEVAEKHLRKGSRVLVQGQLEHERWTDRNGVERTATRVALRPYAGKLVLLGDRGASPPARNGAAEDDAERGEAPDPAPSRQQQRAPAPSGGTAARGGPGDTPPDDDIPF